jgi:VIT1/CCC1 family predicted Fe2+/Mn2+ transporter
MEKTWQECRYEKTFEEELRGLERRRRHEASFDAAAASALLESLYRLDGCDSLGRGEVQDLAMSATIAAHEHFLSTL